MAEPIPIFIPRDSVNDDSVKILVWKVLSGSSVEKDELICEVETSKAVVEIHAPSQGLLMYTAAEGDEVPVGATICTLLPVAEVPGNAARPARFDGHARPAPSPERALASADLPAARLTAAARAIAIELGVDPSAFAPGSLVRRDDVLRKAGRLPNQADLAIEESESPRNPAASGVPVLWEELPRRKILEGRMLQRGRVLSVQSSVTSICRATPLLIRLKGLGLSDAGLQAAIIFEAARLLRRYPMLNAVYERGRLGVYARVNVGWALDGGQGLVVPVIPDADRQDVLEIASLMQGQVDGYLEGTLSPADFTGGTFTVTDLSGQGVSFFDPLIVPGQTAILGIGKGPDYEGQMILHLTLAFDHQATEGKKAAEFLQDLRGRLEIHAALAPSAESSPNSEASERFCVICQRDSKTLQQLKLILLKSEVPPGLVCSLCIAGW